MIFNDKCKSSKMTLYDYSCQKMICAQVWRKQGSRGGARPSQILADPISTRKGRLCSQMNNRHHGFSDLQPSLELSTSLFYKFCVFCLFNVTILKFSILKKQLIRTITRILRSYLIIEIVFYLSSIDLGMYALNFVKCYLFSCNRFQLQK